MLIKNKIEKVNIIDTIKLSLIVPVYGVEKYIHKFLISLSKNLIDGVEAILVDDGSRDNCGAIIDDYQAKYPKFVKVIHKENGGVSTARNAGVAIAKGEYIIFTDPDDYLADSYVKDILAAIEEYNYPDMVFFDYMTGHAGNFKLKTVSFTEGNIDKETFLEEFGNNKIESQLWSRAIRKAFFHRYSFEKSVGCGEDYLLLTDLILDLNSIVYIKKPLYYYVLRQDSLTGSASPSEKIKMLDMFVERYKRYKKLVDNISIASAANYAYGILRNASIDDYNNDDIVYCEKFIKSNIWDIITDKGKDFSIQNKKHCLFVYLGIAKYYNTWKRKFKK